MRLSSVRLITGVSAVFFAAAAWRVGPHSPSDFSAEAQTAKPAVAATAQQLHAVSASLPDATKAGVAKADVTKTEAKPAELKPVAAPGTQALIGSSLGLSPTAGAGFFSPGFLAASAFC